jgi:hypothetical protein
MKSILYIGGCGRSGTTVLGFVLGNIGSSLDLGEVVDFARFEGAPNEFAPGSANYEFWARIRQDLEREIGPIDWNRLRRLSSRYDSHLGAIISLLTLGFFPRRGRGDYDRYLQSLYGLLQNSTEADVLIDGSKYAGRLYHLGRIFGSSRVRVVHLIRNPIDMARSMQGPDQTGSHGKPAALLYYFMVNAMIKSTLRRLRLRSSQIWYEELVADPQRSLQTIEDGCGVNTQRSIQKVCAQAPLERGFIFNGNRMRLQETIVLKGMAPRDDGADSPFDRAVSRVAFRLFG